MENLNTFPSGADNSEPKKKNGFFQKFKRGSKIAATTAFIGGAALSATEATAQSSTAPQHEKTMLHDKYDPRIKLYQDSLALYKQYQTIAKYYGIKDTVHNYYYNSEDFAGKENHYQGELTKKTDSIQKKILDALLLKYRGKMDDPKYLAELHTIDTLTTQRKILNQAARQFDLDAKRFEQEYDGKKGSGTWWENNKGTRSRNFSLINAGGQLQHGSIHPTGEYHDKKGHPHLMYTEPTHEYAFDQGKSFNFDDPALSPIKKQWEAAKELFETQRLTRPTIEAADMVSRLIKGIDATESRFTFEQAKAAFEMSNGIIDILKTVGRNLNLTLITPEEIAKIQKSLDAKTAK